MSLPGHNAPTGPASPMCKSAPLYMPSDGRMGSGSPQASIRMPGDQVAILQLDTGQLAEQEVTSNESKRKQAASPDERAPHSHKRHRPEQPVQMSQEPPSPTAASPAAQSIMSAKAGQACDTHVSISLSTQIKQHQQGAAQVEANAAGAQPGRLGQADALKAPDDVQGVRRGCMTAQTAGRFLAKSGSTSAHAARRLSHLAVSMAEVSVAAARWLTSAWPSFAGGKVLLDMTFGEIIEHLHRRWASRGGPLEGASGFEGDDMDGLETPFRSVFNGNMAISCH